MGYVLMPVNIPGPFDELAVLVIGYYLFVELCPAEIVEEHLVNLRNPTLVKMHQPPIRTVLLTQNIKKFKNR